MSSAPSTRRAVAEIDPAAGPSASFRIGHRSIHGFWHLYSSHFRNVLMAPQRRPDTGRVAWTWRESVEKKIPTSSELADLRRKLSEAGRSLAASFGRLDGDDGNTGGAATPESQVLSIMRALVSQLVALGDSSLARYAARTETGLMLHSWGSLNAADPQYPDLQNGEISGRVRDGANRPIGARVVLENSKGTAVAQQDCGRDGVFQFQNVPSGAYRLRVRGRDDFDEDGLEVNLSRDSMTGIELKGKSHGTSSTPSGVDLGARPWYRRRPQVLLSLVAFMAVAGLLWYLLRSPAVEAQGNIHGAVWQSATGSLAPNANQAPPTDETHEKRTSSWSRMAQWMSGLKHRLTAGHPEIPVSAMARESARPGPGATSGREASKPREGARKEEADAPSQGTTPPEPGDGTQPKDPSGGTSSEGLRSEAAGTTARGPNGSQAGSALARASASAAPTTANDASAQPGKQGAAGTLLSEAPHADSASDPQPQKASKATLVLGLASSGSRGLTPTAPAASGAGGEDTPDASAAEAPSEAPSDATSGVPLQARSKINPSSKGIQQASAAVVIAGSPHVSQAVDPTLIARPESDSPGTRPAPAATAPGAVPTPGRNLVPQADQPPTTENPSTGSSDESDPDGVAGMDKAAKLRTSAARTSSTQVRNTKPPAMPPSENATPREDSTSLENGSTSIASSSASDNLPRSAAGNAPRLTPEARPLEAPPTPADLATAPAAPPPPETREPLVRMGRLISSPWKATLLQDRVVPTRPMPESEEESLDALREKLVKERLALMPATFLQPRVRSGFRIEYSPIQEDGRSPPRWSDAAGTRTVPGTVVGHRAELDLTDRSSLRDCSFTLVCQGGREIARITFDQAGLPDLNVAQSVRAWYWVGIERSVSDGRFDWRLASGGTIPSTWVRDDLWLSGKGQRLDIPLKEHPEATGESYDLALVNPSTGCAIASSIALK